MKNNKEKRSNSTKSHAIKKNFGADPQKNMYSTNKLNAMLHKLKKHYNDMNNIRKAKDLQVDILEKKKIGLQKQIQCKENFTDIEFPFEKITIQDYENLKETKEEIQKKIEHFIQKKDQMMSKYKSEIEYGNTLNNLIEIEKKNFENLNEHLYELKEKLSILKTAQRNIDLNKQEFDKKNHMFTNFKKIQEIECIRLDSVLAYQEKNNNEIVEGMEKHHQKNEDFKKELIEKENDLEKNFKKMRDRTLGEISMGEKVKEEKSIEQNKLIKLVLGLDLIKKYFIDLDKKNIEINNTNLLKSEDYKTFVSKEYHLMDEDNNLMCVMANNYFDGTGSKYERSQSFYNSNPEDNMDNNFPNKTSNNFRSKELSHNHRFSNIFTPPKIYLKDLKDKLENLDMDFDSMDNFYTKIINKTSFYHHHMIIFNSKQINLEGKKEQYIKRVKQIIQKNNKNIDDLVAFNPKFFALVNQLNIDICNDNIIKQVKENLGKFEYISKVVMIKYEEFYNKCQQYFSNLKVFNGFLNFNLEKLVEENSHEDPIKENLKNIFLNIKKNIEYEKNPEFDKKKYIYNLISELEIEYIKENSKLEKIEIAIEDHIRIHNLVSEDGTVSNGNGGENKVYPFIDPYSNWSLDKLEKEKKLTNAKINHMKKCLDLKNYFEDERNCGYYLIIDIPFEYTTFNILGDLDKTVNTINLTKQFIEIFSKNNLEKSVVEQVNTTQDGDRKKLFKKRETMKNMENPYKIRNAKEKEDSPITSEEDEDDKEFLKDFPKSSQNFFTMKNQKMTKRNIMTAKDKKSEFPQIGGIKKNQDIIEKFYVPFIEKKSYNININRNLLKVKSDTRQSAFDSHHLRKKKSEVKKIGKELLIFQNPNINIDNISNITYNSMVKYVIGNHLNTKGIV